jgi:two-component system, OmpR family, alkaline phosphatase synthesis response regulator PhoP
MPKILIVDDEPDILEFVAYNLRKEAYEVETAENGRIGLEKAKSFKPDLVLLDMMMPELDGIETCRLLKQEPELRHTLIAFLTARDEDSSQIAGFEVGADDYIPKPIRPKVLVSRINALLRRSAPIAPVATILEIADLTIDRDQYLVFKKNNPEALVLARKEFELLFLLAASPNKVLTREEIFQQVWGADVIVGTRTIDVHIRKIREKIGEEYITTIKGIGYKFEI